MPGFPIYLDVESNTLEFTASEFKVFKPALPTVSGIPVYRETGSNSFELASGKLQIFRPAPDYIIPNEGTTAEEIVDKINSLVYWTSENAGAGDGSGVVNAVGGIGGVQFYDGTTFGSTANLRFTSETLTVSKINAFGELTVAANASFDTNTLFIDAVNHRVGINTNTPAAGYVLDVAGVIRAESFVGSGALDPTRVANGTIEYVKLLNGTPGRILMINATGNVESITITGDASINSAGVLTLSLDKMLTVNALTVNTLYVLNEIIANGAINALSTLRVNGTFTALNTSSFAGAIDALSTLRVNGTVTTLNTASFAGATNVLSTLGVSGTLNALGAVNVFGATNALSTLGVASAANLFSTLGVAGKITGFDQLEIIKNAIFDTDTLFVDATNHRVGIGNTNPGSPNKLVVTGRTLLQSDTEPVQLKIAKNAAAFLEVSANAAGHAFLNMTSSPEADSRIGLGNHLMLNQNKRIYLEGATETNIYGLSSSPKTIVFVAGNAETLRVSGIQSTINSAIVSGPTIPYASKTTGWGIDREGGADFRYIYADEMHVKNFIADLEQALAGGQIIAKSVAVLYENFTAPANDAFTTLKVQYLPGAPSMQVFQANDYVVLRSFERNNGELIVGDCVGRVTEPNTSNPSYQSWKFTRANTGNAGTMQTGTTVYANSLVLDYGTSGSGYYEVTAVDGVYGVNAPYAQIVTWEEAPVSTKRKVRARLGNLRGLTSTDGEYGLIAGDRSGNQYFLASNKAFDLYGIDLQLFASTTTAAIVLKRGSGNANPYLAIGNAAPTSFTSGTGIWMGRDATVAQDIASAYRFRAGNPDGMRLSWNGSAVLVGNTTGENIVVNPQGMYFYNSSETLGYLSNRVWVLGNTSSNHLVLNTTALVFRGSSSTDLATLNTSSVVIGTTATSRAVMNAAGLTLFAQTTDYAQFSANTRIGTATGPRVAVDSTGIKVYKDATVTGIVLNSDGSGSLSTGNISWNTTGDFNMTGNVTATAGTIGGWSVNTTGIIKDTGTASTSAGLVPLDFPFYAGEIYTNRASAPFRVSRAGSLTATSGSIGGWTLGLTSITGGNIILDGTGNITVGTGANVARISSTNTDWRVWVGNNTPTDAPFRVAANGEITATKVVVLGVSGSATFTGPTSFTGTVNALSTLGVSGIFTALANSTLTGAVNALSTLGVTGVFTALGTSVLTGASNALNTFDVSGTLTAQGQLGVVANANFDGGVLFVDAANNRVGFGTTTPRTRAQVGPRVSNDASYGYDTDALYVVHQTPTSAATLRDPKEILLLGRQGTTNESHGAAASFRLSRFENVGTNSRSRLDLVLAHGAFLTETTTVLTALSNGAVGIGSTSPKGLLSVSDGTYEGSINPRSVAVGTGLAIGTDVVSQGHVLNLAGDVLNGGTAGGVNISMYSNSGWRRALSIRNGGNLLLVPDGYGNVGVSNTIPTHLLRVEGTASINGAFSTDTTAQFGGATNALTTFGVSQAANALSTLGVGGAFTALNISTLVGASNALNTLGVSGTLTALGQLVVIANATFDTNTLFVDAVNDKVGVGTTTFGDASKLTVQGRTFLRSTDTDQLFVAYDASNYLKINVSSTGIASVDLTSASLGENAYIRFRDNLAVDSDKRIYLDSGVSTYLYGTAATGSIAAVTGNAISLIVDPALTKINTALYSGPSIPFASRVSGWGISRAGGADFRYIFADEMHVKNFIADLEQALAGGQIISKSVAVLYENFTAPANGVATTLRVSYLPGAPSMEVFQANDYVVLRSFARENGSLIVGDCVGVVTNPNTANLSYQSWTFTRAGTGNAGSMSTGTVVKANSLVLDYGTSGSGYYEVSAVDGVYAENAPYSQIVTWENSPTADNRTLRVRLGNLKGVTANSGEYGLIAGDYTARQYLRASNKAFDLYGIDLRLFSTSPTSPAVVLARGQSNTNPYFALGNVAPTAFDTGIGIWMGRNPSIAGELDSAYQFRVGNPTGVRLSWNGSMVLLGDTDRSHLLANNGVITFNIGNEVHASLSANTWVLGRTTTNHLIVSPSAISLNNAGTEYAQFAADTRLGVISQNHLVLNSSAITFRTPNGTANLVIIDPYSVTVGSNTTSHVRVTNSAITLNQGTVEYGQFAANTRLGELSNNHVIINSTAIVFRDKTSANLAIINASALVLGKNTSNHLYIDTTGVSLRELVETSVVEYAKFAANTRLGVNTTNHLLLTNSEIIFRTSDLQNTNLATMNSSTLVIGPTNDFHTVVNAVGITLKNGTDQYGQFAATTRIGTPTGPRVEIKTDSVKIYKADSGSPVAGVVLNSDGSGSLSTGNITWDTSGNFNMTGNVTATAGSIGGWTVNSSVIVRDTGTGATSAGLIPSEYPFYAGATYANRGLAPFRVTPDGRVVATNLGHQGGEIANLSISGVLTLSSNAVINSGAISFTTGNGYWLQQNTTGTFMRIGDPANNQIQWNNTQLEIKSNRLTINSTSIFLPVRTVYSIDPQFSYGFTGNSDTRYGMYAFEGAPAGISNDDFRAIRLESSRTTTSNANTYNWLSLHSQMLYNGVGVNPQANLASEIVVASGVRNNPLRPDSFIKLQTQTQAGYARGQLYLEGELYLNAMSHLGGLAAISNPADNVEGLKVYINNQAYRIYVKAGHS